MTAALKLFVGDAESVPPLPPLSGDAALTLSEVYYRRFLPETRHLAKATHSAYRTTLSRHWEPHSDNPPVGRIDRDAINAWFSALLEAGYSDALLRKQWANVQSLLSFCWQELECIERLPRLKRGRLPAPPVRERRLVPIEDIGAWYTACLDAEYPQHPAAALIWRTAVVLGYNYGLRTEDLLRLQREHVVTHPRCPQPALNLQNVYGWLKLVPRKTARKKRQPLILPLNECSRRHLDALLAVVAGDRVLPVGDRPNTWHKHRRKLQLAAGVEPFYFQDLRFTANTLYEAEAPGIGEIILGHAPRNVNRTHYVEKTKVAFQHVLSHAQPREFLRLTG